MKAIVQIFMVAGFFCGCRNSAGYQELRRSEEYAIYSAIIDSLCTRPAYVEPGVSRPLFLLLRDSTVRLSLEPSYSQQAGPQATDLNGIRDSAVFSHLRKALPVFDWQVVRRDFDSANVYPLLLDSARLSSHIQCKLVSASKVYPVLFGRQSPAVIGMPDSLLSKVSGFASFSRIGFNASLREAVVLMTHSVYDGRSDYVIALSKEDSHWVIRCILRSISV